MTDDGDAFGGVKPPEAYTEGTERYVNFAQDILGIRLAETQKRILRAIAEHQRTIIMSGNGPGKSYGVAAGLDGFLLTNPDSVVLGTSGSYGQFVDTMWNPAVGMFKKAQEHHGLPGKVLGGQQPSIRLDTEWYAKVVSPRDPGDLEGRHAENVLVIIEEADKRYITEEHFSSAGSSVTDTNDRMIAIANPPEDKSDVVYDKLTSDRWHTIQFTSFESHNVLADAGYIPDEKIPGLLDLVTIADDWEEWNGKPWPQIEEQYPGDYPGFAKVKARYLNGELEEETILSWLRPGFPEVEATVGLDPDTGLIEPVVQGLDERWYRRRGGVIPPDSASSLRPWTVMDVEDAANRSPNFISERPIGFAYDVARAGGDHNVVTALHGDQVRVLDRWNGVDHVENFERFQQLVGPTRNVPMIVDAQGEGSGVADMIVREYGSNVFRFTAGSEAVDGDRFRFKWCEMLYHFGKFMQQGGAYSDTDLREEALAAAKTIRYDEPYIKSRDATVWHASSKDNIKAELGRSPDVLDSAAMCIWGVRTADARQGSGEGFIITR